MFDILKLPAEHVLPSAVFLTASIAYLIYHYGVPAARLQKLLLKRGLDQEHAQAQAWLWQRLLGGLILGGSALVMSAFLPGGVAAHGWGLTGWSMAWLGLLPLPLLLPILVRQARQAHHQRRYPQIRTQHWGASLRWGNALSWSFYLLGYEAFFRGLLLYSLVGWLGVWPGMLAMTSLYIYAHLPKDAGECVGCLAMGLVFGALTLISGGIWAAWLLHVGIALSNDALCRRAARHATDLETPTGVLQEAATCA